MFAQIIPEEREGLAKNGKKRRWQKYADLSRLMQRRVMQPQQLAGVQG
jgi:hypothetical protein